MRKNAPELPGFRKRSTSLSAEGNLKGPGRKM